MIAVPFIYFSILSLYIYLRHKKVNLAVLISSMFAFSGLFSILVDVYDLRYWDSVGYEITPTASIAYCGLITMVLIPIIANSNIRINNIQPVANPQLIESVAWISLAWFLLSLAFGWDSVMYVLTGNMGEIRSSLDKGNEIERLDWMLKLPSVVRYMFTILNMTFGCSWTLIFLAFFSRFVQKLPLKYFYIFIFSSLSGPFMGIVGADRSKTAYWIIALVGIFILFKDKMNKREKKEAVRVGSVVVVLLAIYLAAMTVSRFGERDMGHDISGTEGGLVSYFGQVYINFCYFFDNYEPAFNHYGIIFPFISQFVFDGPSGGTIIQEQMNFLTHHQTNVFYTFLGQIIIGAGKVVAIIYAVVYTLAASTFLPRIIRNRRLTISNLYLYFAIFSVVLFGLFVHYYTSYMLTVSLFAMFVIIKIIENTKK